MPPRRLGTGFEVSLREKSGICVSSDEVVLGSPISIIRQRCGRQHLGLKRGRFLRDADDKITGTTSSDEPVLELTERSDGLLQIVAIIRVIPLDESIKIDKAFFFFEISPNCESQSASGFSSRANRRRGTTHG
jgi:hypothetical protein